jgi:hypothetical protein
MFAIKKVVGGVFRAFTSSVSVSFDVIFETCINNFDIFLRSSGINFG